MLEKTELEKLYEAEPEMEDFLKTVPLTTYLKIVNANRRLLYLDRPKPGSLTESKLQKELEQRERVRDLNKSRF